MPKIMVNGHEYLGTSPTAEDITYDNSNSSLKSGNMRDAMDELDIRTGDLSLLNTTNKTDLVAAINEVFQCASEGSHSDEDKQLIVDALAGLGVEATIDEDLSSLANKITTYLRYIPNEYALTSSFSYSSNSDVGVNNWTIPLVNITNNEIISLSGGTFRCLTAIKSLVVSAVVYMGCGSMGACRVHLVSNGTTIHTASGNAPSGEKTFSYTWNNIPAGTTFYFQTSSTGSNGPTIFKYANVTLNALL